MLKMLLSCSLWLPLALSGSLLLSEFADNILARLTRPLLSSQRRCCAATLSAALVVVLRSIIWVSFCKTGEMAVLVDSDGYLDKIVP